MAGSGRVPGREAGSGCLCLFRMWRREDSDPGTGLWSATKTGRGREREREEQVKPRECYRQPRFQLSETGRGFKLKHL